LSIADKKNSTLIKPEESKPEESKKKFEMYVNPNQNDSTLPVYFMKHEKLVTLRKSLTNIIKELNNMSAVYRQGNTIIENHKKTVVTAMNGVIDENVITTCQDAINLHEKKHSK
jgi:hypothetical protein